jgi:hypothetical protein
LEGPLAAEMDQQSLPNCPLVQCYILVLHSPVLIIIYLIESMGY